MIGRRSKYVMNEMYVEQIFSQEKNNTIQIHTRKKNYSCDELHKAILYARRK